MLDGSSQFLEFRRGLVDGGDWVLITGGTPSTPHF